LTIGANGGALNGGKRGLNEYNTLLIKRSVEEGLRVHEPLVKNLGSKAGVGNSFGFAGHIRDKLGIRGPVHAHVN